MNKISITKNEIMKFNINQIELENQVKMLKDTIRDLKNLLNECELTKVNNEN